MNMNKLLFSKYRAASMWMILLVLCIFSVEATAQNTDKSAWHGQFKVTISGHGNHAAELMGEPDIEWWIDRSYSGSFVLSGPRVFRDTAGGPVDKTKDSYVCEITRTNPWKVTVSVNDKVVRFLEGPGEIFTHENTTVTTTWQQLHPEEGDASRVELVVNRKAGNYYFLFPLLPKIKTKNVRMVRQTTIDRSAMGYGGKPTHEVQPAMEDMIGVDSIAVPKMDLFLGRQNPVVLPNPEASVPLPASYPLIIEVKKTCLPPAKISIAGVPDGKASVEVCYEYTLSKAPLK
jgi:hypothetical protein